MSLIVSGETENKNACVTGHVTLLLVSNMPTLSTNRK